jgi:hypothetical protein
MVYKPDSDHARTVVTFLNDFTRQTGRTIEELNPESPEGISFCRTYDIVEYPTLIAISHDGQLQSMWRGLTLPTISEVSYYEQNN